MTEHEGRAAIYAPLDPRDILNVNLMAHDNRGPIFEVPTDDSAQE